MGPGLLLTGCTGCLVAHNSIHHFKYTGISTGYGFSEWGPAISNTTLSFNRIHTIGQGELSDMGCVYTWGGDQPGMRIDNNICHGVWSYPSSAGGYGGWGMYNDQLTNGVSWTNNIVYNTSDACYHDHEGNAILVRNNMLIHQGADSTKDGVIRGACPQKQGNTTWTASFSLQHNILVADGGVHLFTDPTGPSSTCMYKLSTFNSNVYWKTGGAGVAPATFPGGKTFEAWQATGQDHASVVADPLFKDPMYLSHEDFALSPDSPAFARGFVPIDTSSVGPRA